MQLLKKAGDCELRRLRPWWSGAIFQRIRQLLKKADDCELLRLRPWCPWWSEDIVQRIRALHEKFKREPGASRGPQGGLQRSAAKYSFRSRGARGGF